MMPRTLRVLPILVLTGVALTVSLVACTDHGTSPGGHPAPLTIHDSWPDEEAELLALILSAEVIAQRALYEQVHRDLASIREQWSDEIPRLEHIAFRPTWFPGQLSLGLDDTTVELIRGGGYVAWDSLNLVYGLDSTRILTLRSGTEVRLYFGPRLNTMHLADAYGALPGVQWARRPGNVFAIPNIFASMNNDRRSYLFWDVVSPCQWGSCEFNDNLSWQFYADRNGIRFSDDWGPPARVVLKMGRGPGLGYCPQPDELVNANVRSDTVGTYLLTGAWLREGDPARDYCNRHMMGCKIAVVLPPRTLSTDEAVELERLLDKIPVEEHLVDYACDPCLTTRYEFNGRVERSDPCATSTAAYDESIDRLETFLHDLAFDE